jgi:membrane-bound inhibitor of C-type lysozyme
MNGYPMIRTIALCLALAGCAASPGGGTQERTYLCDGGRLAVVTFSGETVRVRLANDDFELRRATSGSRERYSGARGALHVRDDEALLMIDGRELGPCPEVKQKG